MVYVPYRYWENDYEGTVFENACNDPMDHSCKLFNPFCRNYMTSNDIIAAAAVERKKGGGKGGSDADLL